MCVRCRGQNERDNDNEENGAEREGFDRTLYFLCERQHPIMEAAPTVPLTATLYTTTVTRRKVAGMEVASSLGCVFLLLKRPSSSACRSASRPLAAAASNALIVGP
jgi:hypothetical protein